MPHFDTETIDQFDDLKALKRFLEQENILAYHWAYPKDTRKGKVLKHETLSKIPFGIDEELQKVVQQKFDKAVDYVEIVGTELDKKEIDFLRQTLQFHDVLPCKVQASKR